MGYRGIRSNKLDLCKKCGKIFLKTRGTNICPICAPQKYSPEFTARPESHPVPLTKNGESTKKYSDEQKKGKWSRKFDRCVNCGGNDVRHRARGLCFNCYERESATKNRGKMRGKYGSVSRKLNYKYLYEEYVKRMRSLEDIAKESSCTRQYILRLMKKYGIERRTQSKARIEALKKGKFRGFGYYEINENFFSEWSPEMAWVLGLLFTDGFIGPSRISIWSMDLELLEKMKKTLNSSNPIGIATQSYDKSKHIYTFAFYREKMMEDLNRLGLHRKKSLDMKFPNVPQEYMRHFIRGCWDGDGSVYITNGKIDANYFSGSLDFIKRLIEELYDVGIFKKWQPLRYQVEKNGKRIYKKVLEEKLEKYEHGKYPLTIHEEKRSKAYYIKLSSKENVEKLFHYLYEGVDESLYLSRKYNVFVKGLNFWDREETNQLNLDLEF